MIMISNFLFNFINFCVIAGDFLTKLLKLGIFISTALREILGSKTVIVSISPLTFFILALRIVLVAML